MTYFFSRDLFGKLTFEAKYVILCTNFDSLQIFRFPTDFCGTKICHKYIFDIFIFMVYFGLNQKTMKKTKSPSFWLHKIYLHRNFDQINQFWFIWFKKSKILMYIHIICIGRKIDSNVGLNKPNPKKNYFYKLKGSKFEFFLNK